jgi:MYXO-CTERM domain-containing protein
VDGGTDGGAGSTGAGGSDGGGSSDATDGHGDALADGAASPDATDAGSDAATDGHAGDARADGQPGNGDGGSKSDAGDGGNLHVKVGNLAGGGCTCSSAPGTSSGGLALPLFLTALLILRRRTPRSHPARVRRR